MSVGVAPRIDTLSLSRGETFVQSVLLNMGQEYATGTSARIVIKDDSDITLATWYGEVENHRALFYEDDVDALNDIPHGAKYELFIDYIDGRIVKHSYGIVVRGENRYPLLPTQVTTNYALQFADTFDRDYVGKRWISRAAGGVKIHDNPGGVPNSMGPNFAFWTKAAVLWYAPLNTDSMTVSVSMLYVGDGTFNVVLCSDYSMSSWLGLQFTQGVANNKVRVVIGDSPTTWSNAPGSSSISNTISNSDNYTIKYNDQTRSIACYKNSSLSPLIQWNDENDVVPNGAGFRYTGLSWLTGSLSPGPEPSSWSVRDGV